METKEELKGIFQGQEGLWKFCIIILYGCLLCMLMVNRDTNVLQWCTYSFAGLVGFASFFAYIHISSKNGSHLIFLFKFLILCAGASYYVSMGFEQAGIKNWGVEISIACLLIPGIIYIAKIFNALNKTEETPSQKP